MGNDDQETKEFWNRVASDWDTQVGESGDRNRFLNSDPVLWRMLGNVSGLRTLDAGCGTGYLARQLRAKGADVSGVDFSESMLAIARSHDDDIDYRQDSCVTLDTVEDLSVDCIVSNYVLMDVPNLEATMDAFARVLVSGGVAVLVFSHPCFPQARYRPNSEDGVPCYTWDFNYFEPQKRIDPPWAHFESEFVWFHRPLSAYWKAFHYAGFSIAEFEEPKVDDERTHLVRNEAELQSHQSRPCSVAFKLTKE